MKISLETLKKNSRDIYFLAIGLVLIVTLIFVFINTIGFLVSSIDDALEVGTSSYTVTKFNIGALENLGIIATSTTSTQNQ
jgi:hypothetical protein